MLFRGMVGAGQCIRCKVVFRRVSTPPPSYSEDTGGGHRRLTRSPGAP